MSMLKTIHTGILFGTIAAEAAPTIIVHTTKLFELYLYDAALLYDIGSDAAV